MDKLKVEYVGINELKPYENNEKIHTDEQIEQICESIRQFGMNDPIAVWKDNEIIEGHGRLMACQRLGYTELPIIRLDHLTEEQRKAYMLIHNKLTMNTGFDIDILEEELRSIDGINMGDFGFSVVIDDIDVHIDQPQEEIARELDEANNYIVLEFFTEMEWERAKEIFGIQRVCTAEKNEKVRRHGEGRVIAGAKWLDILEGEDDEH